MRNKQTKPSLETARVFLFEGVEKVEGAYCADFFIRPRAFSRMEAHWLVGLCHSL